MNPDSGSKKLLGVTRSKGKMYEYNIPNEYHIELPNDPQRLFPLSIGIIGDIASKINESSSQYFLNEEDRGSLLFAAHFLESFYLSKLNENFNDYLKSLIAATYYICDIPGSSLVFSKGLLKSDSTLMSIYFLNTILEGKRTQNWPNDEYGFISLLSKIALLYDRFQKTGEGAEQIKQELNRLRYLSYQHSNSRNLLVFDIAIAIVKLKLNNSVWTILPQSSGISKNQWKDIFKKSSFIKELWPSQKIIAEHEVFKGQSSTIQMPTSAGKTKSTEIIFRSFFFKNSQQTAVLVAPFKALCHEISDSIRECFKDENIEINEFTDVFQQDHSLQRNRGHQIIVTTPEKLVYVLRQEPELSEDIGLLILDEGHQFDNGIRGVTYELLITDLKQMLSKETQIVLISAVLSNADSINSWLNGSNGCVINGTKLSPAQRTIGFVDWSTERGQIRYVRESNIDESEFFVPRVIEKNRLTKKPREKVDRYFPKKEKGNSIALYLGFNLVQNGCVAIFCGSKKNASVACELIKDLNDRNYDISSVERFSETSELKKIAHLCFKHLGDSSNEGFAANLGILTHHASIPYGLRLAVEYALREEKARFVICTSTLAQGVNLPIRYLIFTNIYQAGEKLSVRDFHNLAGRAGRLGIHTEGTILFANPEVYEKRHFYKDKWRWISVRNILNPKKSEPCSSSLLSIFDPIYNGRNLKLENYQTNDLVRIVLSEPLEREKIIEEISQTHSHKGFDKKTVKSQFDFKDKIIKSIESYLLNNIPDLKSEEENLKYARNLTQETLAFHLANDEQKKWLIYLFKFITLNLTQKIQEPEKRKAYGRTLLGINELKEIDGWIDKNIDALFESCNDQNNLLTALWNLVYKILPDGVIFKLSEEKAPRLIANCWINGDSFYDIFKNLNQINCKINAGTQKRKLTVQHIVDICEGSLAFDGMLILGAIIELVFEREKVRDTTLQNSLRQLQKSIKYGLPNREKIQIYEKGYSDRIVAQVIARLFEKRGEAVTSENLRGLDQEIRALLKDFPSYFTYQHDLILQKL